MWQKRAELHNWSFADLGAKIVYKVHRAGILVVFVDPRNTRRECCQCRHTNRANRRTQDKFLCTRCGHASHADYNAALNIRRKASAEWSGRQSIRQMGAE
jgi:transposase